ncbi:hypothetical protein OV207_36415 [Corallococcus sp. BB11-1]|uniref:hypothetical protein n=1 Tax=Corallococcus sp. BB11-1 TaxID=2996783 RepID=UPI00226F9C34|nr:hypothetical protein [Corallococcus sp. BB11-1]MCY1036978.1 hypothetical protein [Corallococcus sp. BB11-1]
MKHAVAAGSLLCFLAAPLARAEEARPEAPVEAQTATLDRAPALVSWKRTLCLYTLCFLEPLIPDLRREWGDGAHWVLSWPLHPWATPPLDVPGPTLIVSPFVEPQLRLRPATFRLLAGARVSAFPDTSRFGVLAEGAGVWGGDGKGGVAGVGLTYDLIERHRDTQPWTVSVVVRRAWTDAGARTDVSLDVTVPLAMFFGTRIPAPEDAGPSSK